MLVWCFSHTSVTLFYIKEKAELHCVSISKPSELKILNVSLSLWVTNSEIICGFE